jgi:hypothetical protein
VLVLSYILKEGLRSLRLVDRRLRRRGGRGVSTVGQSVYRVELVRLSKVVESVKRS